MLTFTANYSHARSHAPAQTRNGSVDLLRFVGAIGIILFHCGAAGSWIGLAALPMFVTLLVFYGAGRPLIGSARRLLVPWLIWSGIYTVLKIMQSLVAGTSLSAEFVPWMFLTGPSIHLWFLPFAFLFLAVCVCLPDHLPVAGLWTICLSLSAGSIWLFHTIDLPIPFAQWTTVIPAACAGLLMQRTPNKILPPMVLVGGCIVALMAGVDGNSRQLAIAGLAVAVAMFISLPRSVYTDFLSEVSFGMYLVHPALIAALLCVVPNSSPLLFPMVAAGSLAITLALRKVLPASV